MIAALIFSKDRALQLDGMLRSFFKCAVEAEGVTLTVLHAASGERLQRQYRELEREYAGRVRFVRESDFRGQVLQLIGDEAGANRSWFADAWIRARPKRSGAAKVAPPRSPAYTFFIVDDTLFVRPFSLRVAAQALEEDRQALGFSFRLGKNTIESYVWRRPQSLPLFQDLPDGVMKYRWADADGDFAYPLELSSSLYRAEMIAPVLRRRQFTDPNSMESQISLNARRFGRRLPFLLCWEYSVAFSAPVNRVQEVFANRSGDSPDLTIGSLASVFDEGKRVDVEAFEGFMPTACHQEVSLAFESARGTTTSRTEM